MSVILWETNISYCANLIHRLADRLVMFVQSDETQTIKQRLHRCAAVDDVLNKHNTHHKRQNMPSLQHHINPFISNLIHQQNIFLKAWNTQTNCGQRFPIKIIREIRFKLGVPKHWGKDLYWSMNHYILGLHRNDKMYFFLVCWVFYFEKCAPLFVILSCT